MDMEAQTLPWVEIEKKKKGNRTNEENHLMITSDDVIFEHGLPRRVLVDYLRKEVDESTACWGLPFTLMLWISYGLFCLFHDPAVMLRAMEDSLDHDILENANFAWVGPNIGHKGMDDVNSIADFWSWMVNGVAPLVFIQGPSWHEGYDPDDDRYDDLENLTKYPHPRGYWLSYNKIVGGVRLSQERAENTECTRSMDPLVEFYDMACTGGYGYELDPEVRRARHTNDPQRVQWLWVGANLTDLQAQLWDMEREKWLDRNTMKVEIAVPAYNGELGLHAMIYINFLFNRGGHIWKRLLPLSFTSRTHPFWYFWAIDIIWISQVLYIFVTEVREVYAIVKRYGLYGITEEYITFWNGFDWFSMACAIVVMGMFGGVMAMCNELNDSLEAMGKVEYDQEWNSTAYQDAAYYHVKTLEHTVTYVNDLRTVMSTYQYIIVLRLFKAYSAQPRLAMVTSTLANASQELIEFLLVFFSVFGTFAISGVVLFGREVTSFGTFNRALFACFRMLFGDLMWEEISQVGRIFAFMWLGLFMIINVMLLLNMLLAIIMKHYVLAKDKAGNAQTLWSEAFESFSRWRSERRGIRLSLNSILYALEKEDRIEEQLAEEEAANNPQPMAMGDEPSEDEEDEDDLGKIIFVEDLQKVYYEMMCAEREEDRERLAGLAGIKVLEKKKKPELSEEQAVELMIAAVEEYYVNNHSDVSMDEVLTLTRRVEYRTKKIQTLAKFLDKKATCENEMGTMNDLLTEMETITDELRQQRDANLQEVSQLRDTKRGLLQMLELRERDLGAPKDDPTTVSALLLHGDRVRYNWRLGLYTMPDDVIPKDPIDKLNPSKGGAVGLEELEFGGYDAPLDDEFDGEGLLGPQHLDRSPLERHHADADEPISDDDVDLNVD